MRRLLETALVRFMPNEDERDEEVEDDVDNTSRCDYGDVSIVARYGQEDDVEDGRWRGARVSSRLSRADASHPHSAIKLVINSRSKRAYVLLVPKP
jgi:hypothetical protein